MLRKRDVFLSYSSDIRTNGIQSGVYVFVAAVDLLNVVDYAFALGAERGNKQCNAGANIGRGHYRWAEFHLTVMANYRCSVRVAKDNLSAHIY